MQKKPVLWLLSILSLVFLSSTVAAQTASPFGGIIDMIKGIFAPFFGISINLADTVVLKILVFLLICPLLGYGLGFVFKSKPNLGWIIAAVLSIMTVMAIPVEVIRGIAYTYATVFMFIIFAVPILGLFLILRLVRKNIPPEQHPFFYHWTCAVIILLIIVVINQVMRVFTSAPDFMTKVFGSKMGYLPNFAIAILSIMLVYHFLAPFFKWGHGKWSSRGSTTGLPPISSATPMLPGGQPAPRRRGWQFGRRGTPGAPPGEAEEAALSAAEAGAAQEASGEARGEQAVQQEELLVEERRNLVKQLAALDLRNLQDLQKIQNSVNELARLAEVYKTNMQALQLISQRLNEIQPVEGDFQRNLEEIRKRMDELQKTAAITRQQMLTEEDIETWCRSQLQQESLLGVRNILHSSAFKELEAVGVTLDAYQKKKEAIIGNVFAAHKRLMEPLTKSEQTLQLLAANVALIENAQARFMASLQAFVAAIKQTLTGQDQSQAAIHAISDARSAFGQLGAALQKNAEYERSLDQALQYYRQVDELEKTLLQELAKENQAYLTYIEQQRTALQGKRATAAGAAAAM